jgi:hypothetical protein
MHMQGMTLTHRPSDAGNCVGTCCTLYRASLRQILHRSRTRSELPETLMLCSSHAQQRWRALHCVAICVFRTSGGVAVCFAALSCGSAVYACQLHSYSVLCLGRSLRNTKAMLNVLVDCICFHTPQAHTSARTTTATPYAASTTGMYVW